MNFTRRKMILYMVIIATGMDFTLPWPVFIQNTKSNVESVAILKDTRFPRQVVQPSWLNVDEKLSSNAEVHVDDQALKEADAIRKTIQKAVDEGTYAVNVDNETPSFDIQTSPTFVPTEATEQIEATSTENSLPPWYLQIQRVWQTWSQSLRRGFGN